MNKEVQTKSKQQQCQAPVFNDKNCQAKNVLIHGPRSQKGYAVKWTSIANTT